MNTLQRSSYLFKRSSAQPKQMWLERGQGDYFLSLFSTTFYTRVCCFLNSWWFKAGLFELHWIPKKNESWTEAMASKPKLWFLAVPNHQNIQVLWVPAFCRGKPTASLPLKTGDKLGETFPFAFTTIFWGKLFVSGYVSFFGVGVS